MEWYYILLIILAVLIVIALIVLCCCQAQEYVRNGDFNRNGYVITTSAMSEAESERYHSSSQTLPSMMPLPPSEFVKHQNRTETVSSYPPKPPPIGFGYSTQYNDEPSHVANRAPYPQHQEVNKSQHYVVAQMAPHQSTTRTPYPPDMQINETSHRSSPYSAPYPPESRMHDSPRSYPIKTQYKDEAYTTVRTTHPQNQEVRSMQYHNTSSNYTAPYPPPTRTPYPPDLQAQQHHSVSYHHANTNGAPYPPTRTSYPPEPRSSPIAHAPSPPARTVSFALTRKTQSTGELPPSYTEVVRRESPGPRGRLRKQLSETSIYDNV